MPFLLPRKACLPDERWGLVIVLRETLPKLVHYEIARRHDGSMCSATTVHLRSTLLSLGNQLPMYLVYVALCPSLLWYCNVVLWPQPPSRIQAPDKHASFTVRQDGLCPCQWPTVYLVGRAEAICWSEKFRSKIAQRNDALGTTRDPRFPDIRLT